MPENIVDQPLPYDREAEQYTISCLMQWLSKMPYCLCNELDFYDNAHAIIFRALQKLYSKGIREVDIVVVRLALFKSKELDQIGGEKYLKTLLQLVPHSAHIGYYSDRVHEMSMRRHVIKSCVNLMSKMYRGDHDAAPEVEKQAAELKVVFEREDEPVYTEHEAIMMFYEEQKKAFDYKRPAAMLSGIPCCDNIGLAFVPGEIGVIAARPSVGKTAFATQMARYQAKKGRPSLLVSIEMPVAEIGARVGLPRAGINSNKLRRDIPTQEDLTRILAAANDSKDSGFYIWAPSRATPGKIEMTIRLHHERFGIQIVFIDFLQIIDAPDGGNRSREIGAICNQMKALAKDLKIPIVMLCQLNRQVGDSDRPTKAHLRESGEIEQIADTIYFLWIEEDGEAMPVSKIGFCTDKNRQGAKGKASLCFEKKGGKFFDPQHPPEQRRLNDEF